MKTYWERPRIAVLHLPNPSSLWENFRVFTLHGVYSPHKSPQFSKQVRVFSELRTKEMPSLKVLANLPLLRNYLFLLFLVIRLANVLLVWTHADPDEFWQGPEVAHRLVFG